MGSNSNIKWKFQWPYFLIGMGFVAFLIVEKSAFDTYFLALVYGLALIIVGFIYTCRYKILHPIVSLGWTGLALWHYFLAEHPDDIVRMMNMVGIHSADSNTADWLRAYFKLPWAIIHVFTVAIINPILMPRVMKCHRLEKSARRIFKLSAEMVYGITNGYTDRPYYAGEVDANIKDIIGFARYLSGKDITRYRVTQQVVELGFSMGRCPMADRTFQRISRISFDKDGKLVVQISKQDYKMYKQHITFDQLCAALSNLFRQFFEYYRNGNEDRILLELKSI